MTVRTIQIERPSMIEKDIESAIQMIEALPSDGRLSSAVSLLIQARAKVATFLDEHCAKPLRMPKVGDRVLYCYSEHDLDDDKLVGEERPAMIVRSFVRGHSSQSDPTVPCFNLQVFTDQRNDGTKQCDGLYYVTSCQLARQPTPGKFRFMPEDK